MPSDWWNDGKDEGSKLSDLTKRSVRPAKPCKCQRHRSRLAIALKPRDDESSEETYNRWARDRALNPWCGRPLESCPEPD